MEVQTRWVDIYFVNWFAEVVMDEFDEILKARLKEELEERQELRSVIRATMVKIGLQVKETAEDYLMLAVVRVAIEDACSTQVWRYSKKVNRYYDVNAINRRTGIAYLKSDMPHAVIIGLNPEWIREVLKKMKLIDLRG